MNYNTIYKLQIVALTIFLVLLLRDGIVWFGLNFVVLAIAFTAIVFFLFQEPKTEENKSTRSGAGRAGIVLLKSLFYIYIGSAMFNSIYPYWEEIARVGLNNIHLVDMTVSSRVTFFAALTAIVTHVIADIGVYTLRHQKPFDNGDMPLDHPI